VLITRWERAGGIVFAAVGLLLTLGGAYAIGITTLSVVVLVLAVRARIVQDPDTAGGFARRRGTLEVIQSLALVLVVLAALVTMAVALLAGWNHDVEGQTAMYALAGVAVLLLREIDRRSESSLRWLKGGRAEERVGAELEPLRELGWLVAHDLLRDNQQNIDHVVCGPHGAFAIETKSRHYLRRADFSQARGHAAWLKARLNQGWVTAVLCLETDEDPKERDHVWIVGRSNLRTWLEHQNGRSIDLLAARQTLRLPPPA
jgi:hypothetical protein